METSLLKTKLNIPPVRPQTVLRPRLIERLKEGLSYNLILVSAPAGFGKTTLLSEWARISQPKVPTTWISVDEGDNDPTRFWDYFIAALQTLQPGCGEKILPWLHSSQPPPAERMLNVLINELSCINGESVIVLDDYHLIALQPIHEGITYLLEHLPAQVHLVIAARADPPLPLARFRGKGIMLEIRTDDLRFSQDDASDLFEELQTPKLSIKDITALTERTEGWVVGLKMAALSMREQKDIPGFITAFTGNQRYVMDYLMEEVLQKQTQEMNDFLVKTSILERLNGHLCDFVTGRKDSQDILLELERGHLFIVPLDESRQWYRYEHLFADLLKHQCETAYGSEQVAALHRQASQWFEDNNLPDEATHYALAAKDWPRAMRLIYARCEILRKLGEWNTLIGWLKTIPNEILCTHLRLYSLYAALLAAVGQLEAAEAAISYLETTARDDAALQGEAAFARSIVYLYRGDLKRRLELCEKAFALLPPDEVAMRSRVAVSIAHARQRLGHFLEAEKWATQACELGQQAGEISVVAVSLAQLGVINTYQGKLKRAVEIYQKVNELAKNTAWSGDQDMLCIVYYILNDLEAVAENARLAVEMAELTGGMFSAMIGFCYQALVCLVQGDIAGADAAMARMDQSSRHPTIDQIWRANHIASRIMYALRLDNLEEAARWGKQFPDINNMMPLDRHIPARLLLAQGKKEAAAKLLQELNDTLLESGVLIMVMPIRICQALAADNEAEALEYLAEALTMAESEGIIRFFVDEGKLLKPLLEKALAQRITPGFTRKLLNIIEDEEHQRRARQRLAASLPLPSILSERELEVLRLIANGLTNQQIADKLIISLNTAKSHVYHIFDKLDAKDRLQAVTRAKELKMI